MARNCRIANEQLHCRGAWSQTHNNSPSILNTRDTQGAGAGKYITENRINVGQAGALAGVPFINIEQLTEHSGVDNKPLFGWKDPIHPNKDGHRIMAEALYKYLQDNHLLGN